MFSGDGNHFQGPGISDVTAQNFEFWEIQCYLIDIGNRTPRFRRAKRSGVTNLQAYRDILLNSFGKYRIVSSIGRHQVPEPLNDSDTLKS
jgi:hypothetical protein